jgi:hypothetical protein
VNARCRDAQKAWMSVRTTSSTISFSRPFVLTGIADEQPPGRYTVEIVEELLTHVSFPAYRRIATMMRLPPRVDSTERVRVVDLEPQELAALLAADAKAPDNKGTLPSSAATEQQPAVTRAAERSTDGDWKNRWHSWFITNLNELTWMVLLAGAVLMATAVLANR